MSELIPQQPLKAFVSCSLREDDKSFNDFVENVLKEQGIVPFGTVGKYSASPENVAESIRKNIPLADLVVIIATPRYIQQDLQSKSIAHGLSEMVHVETGIAYALNKPVLLFVKEGTNVGNFLPNITQYIVLSGQLEDLTKKYDLIHSLLSNAFVLVKKVRDRQNSAWWWKVVVGVLAIVGALTLVKKAFMSKKRKRSKG